MANTCAASNAVEKKGAFLVYLRARKILSHCPSWGMRAELGSIPSFIPPNRKCLGDGDANTALT